jgi:hypothetical protein
VWADPPRKLEFNRDIRPILSDHCFACHGPDANQRQADLRLDTQADAHAERDHGAAIVPGKPAESDLIKRIRATGKRQMPPAHTGKPLSAAQMATLTRWVEEGGQYQAHWSLLPPTLPTVPNAGATHPIDQFVRAELTAAKLTPAAAADRRTLLRRLSFDLLGLPPTPEQVDAFVADTQPGAVERVVDRLLASPHYGERMALYWLDLVRFADTIGYHSDNQHYVALYRDYVINAFNTNLPFDRFTTEQLAGDLLPKPTDDQLIASAYNRLLMTTEEGGAQAKEYLAKYSADRVRNASTVWLGMTLGCAECHDHKFDPYSTKDFYAFAAFFADLQEAAVGKQKPRQFPSPTQAKQLAALAEQLANVQKQIEQTPIADAEQTAWEAERKDKGTKGIPKNITDILAIEVGKRTSAQAKAVATWFRAHAAPATATARQHLADLTQQKAALDAAIPATMVAVAGTPRPIRVLPRGNWLDDSGPLVEPNTPSALPKLGVTGRRATRLDLAQWLVRADNPMTARVFVNRVWKLFFGQGLVRSLDDLGSQGTWPTHPELLDWLAHDFRTNGWEVKRLVRQIVLSQTYQQNTKADEALRQRDPYNLLLARQNRYRLDAELVRDNALAISGLLVQQVGGKSVKPYQPAGYWAMLNFPAREWQNDQGGDLYRRGLYTYWCRTFLHPSLRAFDAPTREECTVERPRSNTPLQALVLLNDPIYVEASRAFAERLLSTPGSSAERAHRAIRLAVQRPASAAEVSVLTTLHAQQLAKYQANRAEADKLLRVGARPVPKDVDTAELAAWTAVTRAVLNLHETITRD